MDGGARDGSTARAVNLNARHVFLSGIDATVVIRDVAAGGSVPNGVMGSDANHRGGASRTGTVATEVIRIAVVGGSAKIGDGEGVANDKLWNELGQLPIFQSILLSVCCS